MPHSQIPMWVSPNLGPASAADRTATCAMPPLEKTELFAHIAEHLVAFDFKHVEANCLREGPAPPQERHTAAIVLKASAPPLSRHLCSTAVQVPQKIPCNTDNNSPALPSGDDIALFDLFEAWRQMAGHVLMPLLNTRVLSHKVQICASNNDAAFHLGRNHHPPEVARTWCARMSVRTATVEKVGPPAVKNTKTSQHLLQVHLLTAVRLNSALPRCKSHRLPH